MLRRGKRTWVICEELEEHSHEEVVRKLIEHAHLSRDSPSRKVKLRSASGRLHGTLPGSCNKATITTKKAKARKLLLIQSLPAPGELRSVVE